MRARELLSDSKHGIRPGSGQRRSSSHHLIRFCFRIEASIPLVQGRAAADLGGRDSHPGSLQGLASSLCRRR
jgi:hypothetical protein